MTLSESIDDFVAEHLPRPSECESWFQQYKKPKIIHDALWGTFELRAHEIALLDTPLLQRLRFIRQTGAVYITYPSALHTRFEHTLGVTLQAARLCAALKSRPGQRRIDDVAEDNVRFAAMLHDTGHGPFSHTSEQYFASLDDIASLKENDPKYRSSGAGEIFSAAIITSSPMRDFVGKLNNVYKTNLNCDLISNLVTGSISDDQKFLSEIVHGPFDADKLDYMPRDGMFSGLKMHVDLDRLFHSIDITTSPVEDENEKGEVVQRQMTRLVGSVAGISPLMQIMFNKMVLFTGIYHHHKVRTVDCMLWAIFQLATDARCTLGGVKMQAATDFLKLTDDRVLLPEFTDNEDIRKLIVAIRNRRLWKRALVISRRTTPESMHNKVEGAAEPRFVGFAKWAGDDREKIRRRRALSDVIWEFAGKPCKKHEVWIDIPARPSMREAKTMWIQAPGTKVPQTLGEFIPISEWVELYGMHQWRAHVFAPHEHTKAVGQAAERALKEEFGLEVLPIAREYAHTE